MLVFGFVLRLLGCGPQASDQLSRGCKRVSEAFKRSRVGTSCNGRACLSRLGILWVRSRLSVLRSGFETVPFKLLLWAAMGI